MNGIDGTYTKRGRGNCPNCNEEFISRYKPEKCSKCGEVLGGSFKAKHPKRIKRSCPDVAKITSSVYSVKTSTKDDRCFVVKEGNDVICLHPSCKLLRSTYAASGKIKHFTCKHVELLENGVSSTGDMHYLTDDKISTYAGGEKVKAALVQLQSYIPEDHPAVIRVSELTYVVFGMPTATNTIGYCHVRIQSDEKRQFKCSGKTCRSFITNNTKQSKVHATCMHLHLLYCIIFKSGPPATGESTYIAASTQPTPEKNIPLSRDSTLCAAMKRSIPYDIPCSLIHKISQMDAATLLGSDNGWPDTYEPNLDFCTVCESPLNSPQTHPGQSKSENAYLLTELNPFKRIKLLVKVCRNQSCKAMHQANPIDIGLFNISDKIVVSLDILLEIRQFFKHGHPLTNIISCKIEVLKMKSLKENIPTNNQLDYIKSLMYNGFYCFEAISIRDLDSVVCGICGISPEILLGDGNEKNCCRNDQINYLVNEQCNQSPIPEDFHQKLKRRWLERTVLTRCLKNFEVNISEVPPIMAPAVVGYQLCNSETEKKSVYLHEDSQPAGDPAMLYQLISNDGFDMNNIDELSAERLINVCKSCKIVHTGKSKAKLITDIQTLYSSMLVGLCPCHGYNRSNACTGGFYHLVCRHGCTFGSKLLTLRESVRDAADLYLSLRYKPTTFICDSPCGLARHMDIREKEVTQMLWGEKCGCFEKPTLDKLPTANLNVPDIVPSEYRVDQCCKAPEELKEGEHPVSGSTKHFILGDGFHSHSNPHKSPLCAYHNIDLCQQANAVGTSTQESENNRKNLQRLRSTCQQSFEVHYMFNYLMDFYLNESIVQKQKEMLEKNLNTAEVIERDSFGRFVIKKLA